MDLANIIERVGFAGGLLLVFWWYLRYTTTQMMNTIYEWRKETQQEHREILASLMYLKNAVSCEEEDED